MGKVDNGVSISVVARKWMNFIEFSLTFSFEIVASLFYSDRRTKLTNLLGLNDAHLKVAFRLSASPKIRA